MVGGGKATSGLFCKLYCTAFLGPLAVQCGAWIGRLGTAAVGKGAAGFIGGSAIVRPFAATPPRLIHRRSHRVSAVVTIATRIAARVVNGWAAGDTRDAGGAALWLGSHELGCRNLGRYPRCYKLRCNHLGLHVLLHRSGLGVNERAGGRHRLSGLRAADCPATEEVANSLATPTSCAPGERRGEDTNREQ